MTTQAELSRHVRGIVKALQAAGLTVTGAGRIQVVTAQRKRTA